MSMTVDVAYELKTIPPDLKPGDKERAAAVSCPECRGSLGVRLERESHLTFRCGIGHTFSLEELLASKEMRLEEALWTAVSAIEELGGVLRDLDAFPERRQLLERQARLIKDVLELNDPVDLGVWTGPDEVGSWRPR
jgi:hypothetical protein